MNLARVPFRSSVLVAVLAFAVSLGAARSASAVYEYEAAYYSYYGYLYSYYAATYEDVYADDFHYKANYYGQYSYYYSNQSYTQNDKSLMYYGFGYSGAAFSYEYQAWLAHGGSYTTYAMEAFRSALAYGYISYYES